MSDNRSTPEKFLEGLLQQQDKFRDSLPPVDTWSPDLSGDLDMFITKDGSWLYQNSKIERPEMVKLFSRILKKEKDEYFLVTPVEKWHIQVEYMPFVIVSGTVKGEQLNNKTKQALVCTTNTGEEVVISANNPLWVEEVAAEPRPLVAVRNNLNAVLSRSVYYQLVECATTELIGQRQKLGIWSMEKFFILGDITENV